MGCWTNLQLRTYLRPGNNFRIDSVNIFVNLINKKKTETELLKWKILKQRN